MSKEMDFCKVWFEPIKYTSNRLLQAGNNLTRRGNVFMLVSIES